MTYGRIHRGPMAADQFTQIRNALFRDARLSLKDKGLFGLISTHRDGWGVTPESLATCCTDGVSGIKAALRNLEKYGYLRRNRERKPDGTLGSSMYFITDQPEAVLGMASAELRRSEPADDYPPVAEPPVAEPTVVNRLHKKTIPQKTRGKNTTSSPAGEDGTVRVAPVAQGGGEEAPQQQDHDPTAAAFVDGLPYRGRIPGPKQRAHLIAAVTAALAAGWTEYALKRQLTADTDNAKSMSAVYRYRLEPENLPAVSEVAASVPHQRPVTVVNTTEGKQRECSNDLCGRPLPKDQDDDLCRRCREESVPA